MEKRNTILLFVMLVLLLAACSAGQSQAGAVVEDYLAALSNKDEALLVSRICVDFEFEALLEFDAFSNLKTELNNVSCEEVSNQGEQAEVVCQGSIEAAYGSEIRSFDLSERVYHLTRENGSWLVCGVDDAQ